MNKNLLGIDFEDWYHPELVKKYLKDGKLEPKVVNGLEKILELLRKNETSATFYIHSWELTPEFMPRMKLSKKDNFITYHNIETTYEKMDDLLTQFHFTSFSKYTNSH